ncbi:MAG TPA: DUF1127 domain-containing protein [Azospirillum sp.]|nr:DUF1127 domain-containing protein [Azospirillum sp.]
MTTLSSDTTSARRPMMAWAATAARAAGRALATIAHRIAANRVHRKAERALMAFDDYGLKDIGIHRGEIHSAVRSKRDPRHR